MLKLNQVSNPAPVPLWLGLAYASLLTVAWSFPLWFITRGIGQRVSLLSLDLFLLMLAVVLLSRHRITLLLAVFLLPLLLMADFLAYGPTGVSLVSASREGLRSLETLPWQSHLQVLSLPVMGWSFMLAGGWRWARWRPGVYVLVALLAVIFTATGRFVPPSWKLWRSGLFESSKILYREPELFKLRTGWQSAHARLEPGYSLAQQHLTADQPAVMIMVESLGVPARDEQVFVQRWADALAQARTCPQGGPVTVQAGIRDSAYFTIDAEFRELCSLRIAGFDPEFDAASCMPSQWAHSVAFHNNSWTFYSRKRLYQQMGFKKVWAQENLNLPNDALTPFGAIADAAVAEKVMDAARQQPGLYYWMTLDLHSPYDESRLPDRELSGSLQVYEGLLQSQLDLYRRMVGALPSHRFFIVGDHMPKFFDGHDGAYQSRRVPYFVVPACP